jgi:hypothetical protein
MDSMMDSLLDSLDDPTPAMTTPTTATVSDAKQLLDLVQVDDDMAGMLDEVLESMNDLPSTSASHSVRSALANRGINDGATQHSPFDEIVSLLLENLTIQEVAMIMGGDFAPMERLHIVLAQFVQRDLLAFDTSDRRIEACARDIVDSIAPSISDQQFSNVCRCCVGCCCSYCQLISYTFTYTVYCGWLVGWLVGWLALLL